MALSHWRSALPTAGLVPHRDTPAVALNYGLVLAALHYLDVQVGRGREIHQHRGRRRSQMVAARRTRVPRRIADAILTTTGVALTVLSR